MFWLFLGFEGLSVLGYGVNAFAPEKLFGRIASNMDPRDVDPAPEVRKGLSIPIWLTAAPNAYALLALTFGTGGPTSPYAAVFIAILLVAQQAKRVPEREERPPGFTRTLAEALREYKPFVLAAVAFYGVVVLAQVVLAPAQVAAAPASLAIILGTVLLLIATVANYLIGSTPRDHHDLLDWNRVYFEQVAGERALIATGVAARPVKASLHAQHAELSAPDFRVIYVHGIVDREREQTDSLWEARLLQVDRYRGNKGIILIGETKREQLPLIDDDVTP